MSDPKAVQLAIGRILRLMSRPTQPGDVEQYEAARRVVLDSTPATQSEWQPNYARDRNRGAQGD